MKTIVPVLTTMLLLVILSCEKSSDVIPPQETFTKFPVPKWEVEETGKYAATMTAVVTLPIKLMPGVTANDKLAVFVNEECRGEGVLVKIDSTKVFFVLIRGLSDEQSQLKFKYYSASTSYMYETQSALNFHVDDVYGTAEHPKILDMIQLK